MIKITKEREPNEWIEVRTTPGMNYEDAPKEALRLSLLNEQGGLCAYCMSRLEYIPGKTTSTRIEHLKSRAKSIEEGKEEETLAYSNMVLCCNGDIDGSGNFHCDKSKDDQTISFNPFDQAVIDTISYSSKDGTIKSSNNNYNREFNDILNLNHPRLEVNRLAVLKALIDEIGKKTWRKKDIMNKLHYYSSKTAKGQFHPYCGIIIWFLNKKLKQCI